MNRANYTHLSRDTVRALYALDKTLADSPLGQTVIDLVKIRVSQLNGCLFCLDMHVKEARKREERELRIYHLPVWRESTLYTEKERACLAWAEMLTKIPPH